MWHCGALACETRVPARVTPAIAQLAYLARARTRVLPFVVFPTFVLRAALSLLPSLRFSRAAHDVQRAVRRRVSSRETRDNFDPLCFPPRKDDVRE